MTAATEGPAYGLTRTQRDELRHELCLATRGGVHRILVELKERGHIDWLPCRRRTLMVRQPIPFPEECEIELTPRGLAGIGHAAQA